MKPRSWLLTWWTLARLTRPERRARIHPSRCSGPCLAARAFFVFRSPTKNGFLVRHQARVNPLAILTIEAKTGLGIAGAVVILSRRAGRFPAAIPTLIQGVR